MPQPAIRDHSSLLGQAADLGSDLQAMSSPLSRQTAPTFPYPAFSSDHDPHILIPSALPSQQLPGCTSPKTSARVPLPVSAMGVAPDKIGLIRPDLSSIHRLLDSAIHHVDSSLPSPSIAPFTTNFSAVTISTGPSLSQKASSCAYSFSLAEAVPSTSANNLTTPSSTYMRASSLP